MMKLPPEKETLDIFALLKTTRHLPSTTFIASDSPGWDGSCRAIVVKVSYPKNKMYISYSFWFTLKLTHSAHVVEDIPSCEIDPQAWVLVWCL